MCVAPALCVCSSVNRVQMWVWLRRLQTQARHGQVLLECLILNFRNKHWPENLPWLLVGLATCRSSPWGTRCERWFWTELPWVRYGFSTALLQMIFTVQEVTVPHSNVSEKMHGSRGTKLMLSEPQPLPLPTLVHRWGCGLCPVCSLRFKGPHLRWALSCITNGWTARSAHSSVRSETSANKQESLCKCHFPTWTTEPYGLR
jgi:hypothetical protein